jgi:TonB family protein
VRKTITAFVPAIFLCQVLLGQYPSDTVFTHVAVMPSFGDCASLIDDPEDRKKCSDQALVQFLSMHLVYPEEAVVSKVEGTVYVNFIVDEKGTVQSPYLLMDIGSGCGEAALQVVKSMPPWEPGLQNGHPAKVKLNLPIQFSLRKSDSSEQYSITWGDIVGDTISSEQLQRNLSYSVYVRGPEGDNRYVDQLGFSYLNGKKAYSAISRGGVGEEMASLIQKIKGGGSFTISASVQENGHFVDVSRTFQILE